MLFPLYFFINRAISLPNDHGMSNSKITNFPEPISLSNFSININGQRDCINEQNTLEFSIKGEKFEIWGIYDKSFGEYEIYLDDIFLFTVNQSKNHEKCQIQYSSELFEYGYHKIKLLGKGKRYEICKFNYWPSIHAKRLNFSEFKNFNWDKESDNTKVHYRPSNNMNNEVEKEKVFCSKIWIFGSKNIDLGSFTLNLSNRYSFKIDQKSDKKIDCELLYETDYFDLDEYTLKLIYNDYSNGDLVLDCIYYDQTLPTEKSKSVFLSTENEDYSNYAMKITADQDYSNNNFENLNETIYIDDNYLYQEITDSQFIDYVLLENQEEYLFVVSKSFTFKNVKFIINGTDTGRRGAIKIENSFEVTIENCEFIRCSVGQGNGGAIYMEHVGGQIIIKDCLFYNNSAGGILISQNVESAVVKNCVFNDCYSTNQDDFVIIISNQNSDIINNIINFTNNEISIGGIKVTKHGKITIAYNKIIKTGRRAFNLSDTSNDGYENECVIFNYNLIEDVRDYQFSTFQIQKIFDFNIDHNIIKNCNKKKYSFSIELSSNRYYSTSFILTNLSLIQYSSGSPATGGLGYWIVFYNKIGSLTLQDCYFENNQDLSFTGGGAFMIGQSSIGNMSINIFNCQFINNYARTNGGALSIRCGQEAIIYNCSFINNKATLEGGAIYISPSQNSLNYLVPHTTIAKCTFESNQDSSSKGHAIYFRYASNCDSIVEIKDDCYFINNGNTTSNGFTISSDAPGLIISNIIIEFDSTGSTSGLLIETAHTNNATINNCKFINTIGSKLGAIQAENIDQLSIFDCIFDSCTKDDIPSFILSSNSYITFTRNTIQNCKYLQNLGKIEIKQPDVVQIISDCKFIGNSQISSDNVNNNETSGLLIQQTDSMHLIIIYEYCKFENNNVSSGCGGSICICSQLPTLSPKIELEINNCTFSNNTAPYDGGALYISLMQYISFFGSEFYDNSCGHYGGALYIGCEDLLLSNGFSLLEDSPRYSFELNHCIFERNYVGKFGNAMFINDTDFSALRDYSIENNKFIDNYDHETGQIGYVIASKKRYLNLDTNIFYNNDETIDINSIVYLDEYDTIIYENLIFKNLNDAITIAADSTNKLIKNCTFINCCTKDRYVIILHKIIIFEENIIRFDLSSCSTTAGLLIDITSLPTNSELIINNSTFERCSSSDQSVTGIYIKDNNNLFPITVSYIEFYNCFGLQNNVIKVECQNSIIENSIFSFSSNHYQASCGAIFVNNEFITISNNQFINVTNSAIKNTASSITNPEDVAFNMSYNTFTGCLPYDSNGVTNRDRMWNLDFNSNPVISHNIVENATYDHYYLFISIHNYVLILENTTFRNLHLGAPFGGGLSHWFVSDRSQGLYNLTLRGCKFHNNEALDHSDKVTLGFNQNQGGAIQHGWTQSTANCYLTFDGCEFISNTAPDQGGAIAVETNNDLTIHNCIFENNKGSHGGAIYVSPDYMHSNGNPKRIIISSCQFKSNIANNGNAIYVEKGAETTLEISNCAFTDDNINEESNSLGYCIVSGCKSTIINDFSINVLSQEKITGGLNIIGKSSISITKFNIDGPLDQAIKLDNSVNLQGPWIININESSFVSDQVDCCTILLSDSSIDEVSNISINYNQFSNTLLKLEISIENPITIHDIIIYQSDANNEGTILSLPTSNTNDITMTNTVIERCSANTLFSFISENIQFENCNFLSNQISSNGTISIKPNQKVIFNICRFEENNGRNGKLGGALYVEPSEIDQDDTTITIKQCAFIHNSASDGSAIYSSNTHANFIIQENTVFTYNGEICTVALKNSNLDMSDVIFRCSYPITFYDISTISDIEFRNVISENSPILIIKNENSYSIDRISFYNCKGNDYIIRSENDEFSISNSHIEFPDITADKSCGGIEIKKVGNHKIISTEFIKTIQRSIKYEHSTSKQGVDEMEISNCIFDGCSGKANDRVFSLKIPNHKLAFENNTIQNTQDAKYGATIEFIGIDEFNLINCKFINNSMYTPSGDEYSGGCGLWICRNERIGYYRQLIQINYSNCQWINNSINKLCGGGAIQIGKSSLSNIELTFSKCEFIENKALRGNGGALSIQTIQPLTISECIFSNNNVESPNGFGGAIYINPDFDGRNTRDYMSSCDIINCTFEGNYAPTSNGHAICMEGGVDTLLSIFSNNTFKDNNDENEGGSAILYKGQNLYLESPQFSDIHKSRFIEFGQESSVDLHNVEFQNCNEKDGDGNAIKISSDSTSVSLTDCNFTNCGSSGYIIKDLGATISFVNCAFTFDDSSNACCALDITTLEQCDIQKCKFINNFNNNNDDVKSAPLYYHPTQPGIIVIQYCLFDQCNGNEQNYKAFSIQSQSELIFSHNTVQNIGSEETPSKYIGEIVLSKSVFEFERCNFNNIISKSQFGGGCGLKLIKDSSIDSIDLSYESCEWNDNHAVYSEDHSNNRYNGVGGAYQQGLDPLYIKVSLTFNNCSFLRNKSDREGGALAIQTVKTVNVRDCFFKDNRAGVKIEESSPVKLLELPQNVGCGGAIYIDPDFSQSCDTDPEFMQSFNIIHSVFIKNEATNDHAIYIRRGKRTHFNIQDGTVFTDNGKSGCTILCESDNLNINTETIFNFTNSSESSRPIDYFGPDAVARYENLILKDISAAIDDKEGNAIHIPEGIKETHIINCTFINCGLNNKGFVVTCYSTPLEYSNNTITFDNSDDAIRGLGVFTQGRIIIEGSLFERCNSHDIQDGGGGLFLTLVDIDNKPITNFDFNNNTFDNISGINKRCFSINYWITLIKSSRISIINSPDSGNTGAIFIIIDSMSPIIELKEWSFINNTAHSKFGGGCGIWIAENSTSPHSIDIRFIECTWYGNRAKLTVRPGDDDELPSLHNGLGGAYQQGFSRTNSNCSLTFENCLFENNEADAEGGALAIQTTKDCNINNCKFINNRAGLTGDSISTNNGGAIFIDPYIENPLIDDERKQKTYIDSCIFENNIASNNGHAFSLTGDDAEVMIINNTFNNNGDNKNSVLYSICSKMTVKNNTFENTGNARAIELEANATIELTDLIFINCYSHTINNIIGNGGAILLQPSITQASLLASNEQSYEISNCTFTNCGADSHGGSIFIAPNVNEVSIAYTKFDGGSVKEGEGIAIYISNDVSNFRIDSSVEFINQNHPNKFVISSSCNNFNIQDISINNIQFGSGIKGLQLNEGVVDIRNMFFSQCITGIEVNSDVSQSTIENCIFSDCFCIEGNNSKGQVIKISNQKSTLNKNRVNFTSNTNAIAGLLIDAHGEIDVTHNEFIKIRKTGYINKDGSITIEDTQSERSDIILNFNYNLIEDVYNIKFGVFAIIKQQQFNFDHNIIKNCIIKQYSCQINMESASEEFGKQFTLTNLTLKNCESNSKDGGGFGIWIAFKDRDGKFTFNDCHFENNKAGPDNQGGYGGAFSCGLTGAAAIELLIDCCEFINNNASLKGGALSLQSLRQIIITNCNFTNNQATNGGGAVYIHPDNRIVILPNCIISQCNFNNNKATSNDGHAIFFEENAELPHASTVLTIEENCNFIDNGDLDNHNFEGYVIVSMAPTLEFKDSRIEFFDDYRSTPALKLAGSSTSILNNVYFLKTNSNDEQGYDAYAIFIDSTTTKAEINFCTFDRCGTKGSRSAILDEGKDTIIDNCKFLNTKESYHEVTKTGAVYVKSQGKHIIQNCFTQYNWGDEGAFQYKPEKVASDTRSFTFRNITIDDVMGNNNVAIYFIFNIQDILDVGNVTIKNTREQGICMVEFDLAEDMDEFTINEFRFINNYVKNNFMGGSGMWIRNRKQGASIKFDRCYFERNQYDIADSGVSTSGCGGAFSLGNHVDIIYSQIIMTECQFIGNQAEKHGGALAFSNLYPVSIIDCVFTDNKANGRAGAIYIDFPDNVITSHTFTITGCSFDHNIAGETSSALIMELNRNTHIDISESTFSNNLNGFSIIYSKAANLKVHDINFEFPDTNSNVRSLCLGYQSCTEVYNVNFVKCSNKNDEGAAIKCESEESTGNLITFNADQNKFMCAISDCIFSDCGNKGSVVYSDGTDIEFIRNTISFTQAEIIANCLYITKSCNVHIESSTFSGIRSLNKNEGRCIYYHDDISNKTNSITIKNITFENAISNIGSSIYIKGILEELTITECIFNSNFDESNSSVYLSIYPTSFNFINNTMTNFNGKETSYYFMYINCNNNIEALEFINITFVNNTSNSLYGGGSGVHIEGVRELLITECNFHNNKASQESISLSSKSFNNELYYGNGGGFQIGYNCMTNGIEITFENCIFTNNKADQHGGAISIQTTSKITITNCTFEGNIANYRSKEGKGGSIFINPSFDFEDNECQNQEKIEQSCIQISDCNFINNEGYDGHAIYLSGENHNNIINITRNEFINEFDETSNLQSSSIILNEICTFSIDELLEENNFTYNNKKVNIYSQNCRLRSTQRFTPSDLFTKSETFEKAAVVLPPTKGQSKKITFSMSYSLTYIDRKSVSFSLSYVSSNTFEMSFDASKGTYLIIESHVYSQQYFPYIIHYYSPVYIEQSVTINIITKKRISPEQLIGISCGSASVFFLVLGIVICSVKRHNELKNQFNEFDDLSYSSNEVEIKKNVKETVINDNNNNDNKQKTNNDEEFDDFLEFWV